MRTRERKREREGTNRRGKGSGYKTTCEVYYQNADNYIMFSSMVVVSVHKAVADISNQIC